MVTVKNGSHLAQRSKNTFINVIAWATTEIYSFHIEAIRYHKCILTLRQAGPMKVNKIDHTPRKTGGATYSLDLGSNGLHRESNKLEDTLYFC